MERPKINTYTHFHTFIGYCESPEWIAYADYLEARVAALMKVYEAAIRCEKAFDSLSSESGAIIYRIRSMEQLKAALSEAKKDIGETIR